MERHFSAVTENLVERIISQGFQLTQQSRPGPRPGRGPRLRGPGGWAGARGAGQGRCQGLQCSSLLGADGTLLIAFQML